MWAADITPDETPFEAGLGLLRAQGQDVHRLRCARAASPSGGCAASCSRTRARWRSATSRCGSAATSCGRVTSGGYGYTVERSIAYAYLPADVEIGAAVEIDIFGQWVAGVVAREPLLDPQGERVRLRPT